MRVTFLMNENDRRAGTLLHNACTWLQHYARSSCNIRDEDLADEDDAEFLARVMIAFRDPLDAIGLYHWRDMSGRGKLS